MEFSASRDVGHLLLHCREGQHGVSNNTGERGKSRKRTDGGKARDGDRMGGKEREATISRSFA